MFKLLTEEERIKVAKEYSARRVTIMLVAVALSLMVGVIGVYPSYNTSHYQYEDAINRVKSLGINDGNEPERSELQTWLDEFSEKLNTISPSLDNDRPASFVEKVLETKIPGISIRGFSWTRTKDKLILTVSGRSSDRQTLIEFERRINSSGHFTEVALPISNLAKDRDIDFQIKFSPSVNKSPETQS